MKLKRKREFVKLALVLAALPLVSEERAMAQSTQPGFYMGTFTNTEASFLTGLPTPDRNNFTGAVGFHFQVSQAITVTSLGRYYQSAGSSHVINLWNAANTTAPLATATIPPQQTLNQPSIVYATVTPVTLSPGTVYALAIDETAAGDLWVDNWAPSENGFGVLNSIITNIAEAFSLTHGTFPSYVSTAGAIYDTPAMIFTTSMPVVINGAAENTNGQVTIAPGPTNSVMALNYSTPMLYFMRALSPPPMWQMGSYIGPNGDFNTNSRMVLAGNQAITLPYTSIGAMLSILPAPNDPAGIIFETPGPSPANYAYGVLDASGNFRFSQQNDGSHCWGSGANANQSLNDVCLARPGAGKLEVNSGTAGSYAATKLTAGGNVLDTNGMTLVGVSQPVCSPSLAGKLWYSGHTPGAKDSAAICAADATNTFAWRTLY
jgi:hypothetical protein